MTTATVKLEESTDTDALLGRIDVAMRGKVLRQAARAAAAPVRREARRRAPRSSSTGTREHWSAATRATREGYLPLAKTIQIVVRDYGTTFVAVVGPRQPEGALAHLIEEGHELVAWGHATNIVVSGEPFMEPAADLTKDEQQRKFIDKIQSEVAKIVGK